MTALFPDPEELVKCVIARRGARKIVEEVTLYDAVFMETCGVDIFAHAKTARRFATNGYGGRDESR